MNCQESNILLITITIRVIHGFISADRGGRHSKTFVAQRLKISDFSAHQEKRKIHGYHKKEIVQVSKQISYLENNIKFY